MTKIKKDPKTGKYGFVYSGGFHPITKERIQRKRQGIPSLKEAKEALKQVILEVEKEKLSYNINKVNFGEYIEQWFEAKKVSLRSSTIVNYNEQLKYNIIPFLANYKLCEINEQVLQNYINDLCNKRELAPKTVRTAFGIVSEVLKKASRKNAFEVHILSEINLPRENKIVRAWAKEDIRKFLNAPNLILNLTRYFIGFEIGVQTGMRMGEILGLRWSDIDFERKLLTVKQTLSKIDEKGNYGLVSETKTHSSFRQIYLQNSLCVNLKKHKEMIEREKQILGEKYNGLDLVLCTNSGNWVHPNNYRRAFHVTCEYLQLPKIRLYDLRHTHATFLISVLEINPKIVQERLGHANIKTTLGTYSHVLPSMQLEVTKKIDQEFN
ncbi:tyrosine-type recombinase/integrase [Metabacillus fastidiosus]|uniref:Tyrosine-type recombinase/integrase n=1 Tax=Metabacillus fastidiosus TaxID=1458 RepID=A0ABU6P2Z9_9BACI|nr:tyrosine-type recombinase/integrase [Metabacillus fastidiosus]MED4403729.1 tyrosine-type recombinase/integrase [Metabacillus fastidiosus]